MPARRFRYGPWRDGPDPLAPPFDLGEALDRIGADVLGGASVRDALRRLLEQGVADRPGLRDLAERVRAMREQARRGDLAGALDQARGALDQALAAERDTLAGEDDEAARWAEWQLDNLPDDVAGAVRELADYDWHSDEARSTYEAILQRLRGQVLDARLTGFRQAMSDPEQLERMKQLLADLNELLAAHARGEDTDGMFDEFMQRHGDQFPEQPANVEELIDVLARRQAAADALMASLTPEQRGQLSGLIDQALADPELARQLDRLAGTLQALRPGGQQPVRMSGGEPLGYADAVQAVAQLAELNELQRQLAQTHAGASLDDVDVEALERHLGGAAAEQLRSLRELARELERQGLVRSGPDGLRLTPRAVRRLGETALRTVFERLDASGRGEHADRRSGVAGEPTGLTRPWAFGDELAIDAARTVGNALRRGGGLPARLAVDDFEVVETERRTAAAVALCVDLSFSMVSEGRWGPMKQTALALSHLVETRFRQDALQVIGFNLVAQRLSPLQLAEVEPEWVQGTNLQHALLLADQHLRRHRDAEPVVLVVTDGEPTAHLTADGSPWFGWPTGQETLRATVGQIDRLSHAGAALNFFLLGDDPGLARFVDAVARRAGGRVFTPSPQTLGEYVVADYLRSRRGPH